METPVTPNIKDLLVEREAAEVIHAKSQTLRCWRNRGKGPAFYKISGKIMYRLDDLKKWIEDCRVVPGERPKRTDSGVRRSRATKRGSRPQG